MIFRKLKKFYAFFRYGRAIMGNRRFRALERTFRKELQRTKPGDGRFTALATINQAMMVILRARDRKRLKKLAARGLIEVIES